MTTLTDSSDKKIASRLHAAFEKESRINLHRHPIRIAVQDGDLVLEGEVEDIAVKKLALVVAADHCAGHRIVDRVRVSPAELMGDAEIRDHVCRALLQEGALEHCRIRGYSDAQIQTLGNNLPEGRGFIAVEVHDGVVTLNGRVPSLSHKRVAGVLAWWVPGSRDVINGLEEVPPEEDNDAELTDAVRLVLEKNPFINAAMIRVTSKEWIVTLEGLVPTETMKKMAERDTWYVLGTKRVINNIRVGR